MSTVITLQTLWGLGRQTLTYSALINEMSLRNHAAVSTDLG